MKLNRKTRAVVQRRKILLKKHRVASSFLRMHERFAARWQADIEKADSGFYPEFVEKQIRERLAFHKKKVSERFREVWQIERKLDKRIDNLWKAIFEPSDEPDEDAKDTACLRGTP